MRVGDRSKRPSQLPPRHPTSRISPTCPHPPQVIRKKQNPFEIYRDKLVSSGVVSKEEAAATSQRVMDTLEAAYEESKSYVPRPKDWLSSYWEGFKGPMQHARIK